MLTNHEIELFEYINDHITLDEVLNQLAEEASELSGACSTIIGLSSDIAKYASKLPRTYKDSNNPTPLTDEYIHSQINGSSSIVCCGDTVSDIFHEVEDFTNVWIVYRMKRNDIDIHALDFTEGRLSETAHKKLVRWACRLGYIDFDEIRPDNQKKAQACALPVDPGKEITTYDKRLGSNSPGPLSAVATIKVDGAAVAKALNESFGKEAVSEYLLKGMKNNAK